MAVPTLTRTYTTRRNIPLLDTSSLAQICKSWALARVRSMKNTEVTGTMSGVRNANSVWNHLRSCDGAGNVSLVAGTDLWTDLTKLVGNSPGSNHSWWVGENPTSGYQCCIDLNTTLTGGFFRIVYTKISSPFSTGTATVGPISANEWTDGVVAGGTSAGFTFFSETSFGSTIYFHYSESGDGEFFCLTNRIGAFAFNNFNCFQKTTAVHVSDTSNAFSMSSQANPTPGTRGAPTISNAGTSPQLAGRVFNDSAVMSTGGVVTPIFGGTSWITNNGKDAARNEYPAFRMDLGNNTIVPALRGYFRDMYSIGIEISRIGQVFPTVSSPTHVVAGEFLVPFVGGSPSM